MSRYLGWRVLLVLVVIGGAVGLAVTRPINLGLDLRGGTQIVLEAQPTEIQEVDGDTMERTLEVMRRRVDQLGVTEPTLQRSGSDRLIVELPGVTEPEEALDVIGRTAQLTFHAVVGALPPDVTEEEIAEIEADEEGLVVVADEQGRQLVLEQAELTGDAIQDAAATFPERGTGWEVIVDFRRQGADQWADLTGRAACAQPGDPTRMVAIVLDDEVISAPEVSAQVACGVGITGGSTVITGAFTQDEANNLALLIRAGALPVPVEVMEQRTVGPTLGEAAIDASVQAALIGAALTILFMIGYYRLLGGLAAIALGLYALISLSALMALGATLTLPGIAGFVLAIGMAVDANILVFERMKEEHAGGRQIRSSAIQGFRRAWSAIADSNVTTLIAAVLLFFFASGPVRGFGVTLSIGVLVSMFTALVITRVLVDLTVKIPSMNRRQRLMGIAFGARLRRYLADRGPDIVGRGRTWFVASGIVVLIAIAAIGVRGLNLGVEFTGGRLMEYETTQPVDLNDMRTELAAAGFPRAVVQETGDGHLSIRTGELTRDEQTAIHEQVESLGGSSERIREEFIGPTIGDELRRAALIALGLAVTAQLAYLAVRFRWTFGLSAVVAMFHDVVILVGLFALLGRGIDGVFMAATLTVIGYSINDSVVIFDRIREERRTRLRDSFTKVANDACLLTLPRTFNTGLGVLFILGALFFLGGDTLTDFALALIVGLTVGSYSSLFIAAPLSAMFERRMPAQVSTGAPVPGSRAAQVTARRAGRKR